MELMEWWKTALSKRICKNSSVLHINISVINSSYGCFVVAFVGLLAASENAKYVDFGVQCATGKCNGVCGCTLESPAASFLTRALTCNCSLH